MRSGTNKRSFQCDLRTALGPGTQYVGVTEAILKVVACQEGTRSPRYCDNPKRNLGSSPSPGGVTWPSASGTM